MLMCKPGWVAMEFEFGDGSIHRGLPRGPGGVTLVEASHIEDQYVVAHLRQKLDAHRQRLILEPARYADGGEAQQIPNSTERICKAEIGLQVCFKGRGRDWQRRRGGDVKAREKPAH